MGIFDFFRKIPKIKIEGPEIEKEKVAFSDIGNWVERKRNELEIREKEVFILTQKKIDVFIDELEGKINALKEIDISKKKVEGKIESIVNESRRKYIESLRDFVEGLEGLKKEGLDEFIKDIDKVFLDFNRSSYKSYERTTLLIGKEMSDLKDSLRVFSENLIRLFNENKDVVDSFDRISIIRLNLKEIEGLEKDLGVVDGRIIFLDGVITERERERGKILWEAEKIKEGGNYLRNLEIGERVKLLEGELEKNILDLRQSIDFKVLTNFFHIFKEQMDIVKAHRDDFQMRFREDDGESIVVLLNESKLNNETISEKINQIKNNREEIIKNKLEIGKDETEELFLEMGEINQKINGLKDEKVLEEKRCEKIKANRKELRGIVRGKMIEMGVEIREN